MSETLQHYQLTKYFRDIIIIQSFGALSAFKVLKALIVLKALGAL